MNRTTRKAFAPLDAQDLNQESVKSREIFEITKSLHTLTMARTDDKDLHKLICDPWDGSRTPAFRTFKRDFQAGAMAMSSSDSVCI